MPEQTNWAGNYTYTARQIHSPRSVDDVRAIVAGANHTHALGTRHSFNHNADTTGDLISLEHLNRVVALDRAQRTVTVEAGIRYGELGVFLQGENFALPNLASLPHLSVAGACATATHGSGVGNRNLAASAAAMEIVTANGEVMECSRASHGDEFDGMVVALGGLGIVTILTLDLVPAFRVRQDVYENLPWAILQERFQDIMASGYSVSLFLTWRENSVEQVWLKRVVESTLLDTPQTLFGATRATVPLHPIPGMSPENCNEQLGVPGAWHERLPHFRIEFTPSAGKELQSEYFVARQDAPAALEALRRVRERFAPLVLASEVRTIAADELWLSPCYQRASAAIHFTWVQDWDAVRAVLPLIESVLAPFNARPHWGKLFTVPPARLHAFYPKMRAFQELLQVYDPQGKFRNAFLQETIFGA